MAHVPKQCALLVLRPLLLPAACGACAAILYNGSQLPNLNHRSGRASSRITMAALGGLQAVHLLAPNRRSLHVQWAGFIKDYDGGTLMECRIHPSLPYADFPGKYCCCELLPCWLRSQRLRCAVGCTHSRRLVCKPCWQTGRGPPVSGAVPYTTRCRTAGMLAKQRAALEGEVKRYTTGDSLD